MNCFRWRTHFIRGAWLSQGQFSESSSALFFSSLFFNVNTRLSYQLTGHCTGFEAFDGGFYIAQEFSSAAVGKVDWKPSSISEDVRFQSVPCFIIRIVDRRGFPFESRVHKTLPRCPFYSVTFFSFSESGSHPWDQIYSIFHWG